MNDRARTIVLAVLGFLIAGLTILLLVIVLFSDGREATAVTTTDFVAPFDGPVRQDPARPVSDHAD